METWANLPDELLLYIFRFLKVQYTVPTVIRAVKTKLTALRSKADTCTARSPHKGLVRARQGFTDTLHRQTMREQWASNDRHLAFKANALLQCDLKVEVDLSKASCACRKWRRVFHDPSLWRSRSFDFSGYYRSQAQRMQQRLSGYVSAMGSHLQRLDVACSSPNLITAYSVAQGVRLLLLGLADLPAGRRTLHTFTLRHLNFDESWDGFRASKHVLVSSLSHFLQSQAALRSIDLKNAFLTPPFSHRVLRCVGASRSRATLTSLSVVNLFCCDTPSRYVAVHLMSVFRRCWRLSEISLNYIYLHAIGAARLCEALADSLLLLRLDLYVLDQTRGDVIRAAEWTSARLACPRLQVTLNTHCWPREPGAVIVASLPLRELPAVSRDPDALPGALRPPPDTRLLRRADDAFPHGQGEGAGGSWNPDLLIMRLVHVNIETGVTPAPLAIPCSSWQFYINASVLRLLLYHVVVGSFISIHQGCSRLDWELDDKLWISLKT
ncbi:hypothetical protein EGW08_013256 [Elysia chlorotica]|uniref:F-box domain-containing protein n=1 Tax=Elysia chlorotica TaxID=188477 RepID=A0A433TBS2_ELYCH|nr:hypothetical protein EGW08_013256 [Elysia chlorotica]